MNKQEDNNNSILQELPVITPDGDKLNLIVNLFKKHIDRKIIHTKLTPHYKTKINKLRKPYVRIQILLCNQYVKL